MSFSAFGLTWQWKEITCTHPRTVIQEDEFQKEIFWCKCSACGLAIGCLAFTKDFPNR